MGASSLVCCQTDVTAAADSQQKGGGERGVGWVVSRQCQGWGGRACRRENQKNQYLGRARADDGDATISVRWEVASTREC